MVKLNDNLPKYNTLAARIDCSKETIICDNEEVQNFPTIRLYKAGSKSGIDFEAIKDVTIFEQFLRKNVGQEVYIILI